MLGPSSRATNFDLTDIERRMQALERQVERLGGVAGRASANFKSGVADATERVNDVLVSALSEVADRFRGGAGSLGGEAARVQKEAVRLGNDALRRLSAEVEHRPLVVLAIAAGVGLLIGLAARRP
jgi:ElaB/YqjD/DUF883 family membrane-anchored ribosome-binding protein